MTSLWPTAVLLTTGLSRTCGGPFFSVSGLAAAVAASGLCDVAVVGTYSQAATWPQDRRQWEKAEIVAVPNMGFRSARVLAKTADTMIESASKCGKKGLVHVSGLWDAASLAGTLLQRNGRTCMLSPRGMLEPWALQQKASKKRLAMLLWQRQLLSSAALLHATAPSEVESIRNLGLRTPVCVIPNGVDFPADDWPADSRTAPPGPASQGKTAVFLSRIHPKKGLPLLLQAWAAVRPAGWSLQIAGISEDQGHEVEMRRLVRTLGLESVQFVGERSGAAKWGFLRSADLFVLPSYSENFGIVVAEAMASGLPVISTTGTPWQALRDERMGWWVEPSVTGLVAALSEACSESDAQRSLRGKKARAYARLNFGWDEIGRRMVRCYQWALGIGPITEDIFFA